MSDSPSGGVPAPPADDTAHDVPRDDVARDDAGALQSRQALARHAASMRRPRLVYFAVVTVVVVALGVFAAVVWSRGEAAHVTLHTAAAAPPSLGVEVPATTQRAAWRTTDRAALNTPQYGGTVVTWSEHTVRGRNARTGKITWSYTRTDRSMCTSLQLDGTTVAIYAVGGNCDEVTALNTGTGKRQWTRTLDEDGMPLNGYPSYSWTMSTFVVYSSSVAYAIDPVSGIDRWTYTRYGCRIGRVVIGSAGALISQNCSSAVQCTNVDKCRSGPQLLLRNGSAGLGDSGKPDRDQLVWNDFGNTDVPVSADSVVSAFNDTTKRLTEYRSDTGKSITTVRLRNTPSSAENSVAAATTDAQLVWLGGVTYALSAGTRAPIWATTTLTPPTVTATNGTGADLPSGRFTVATSTGAALLDGNTGRVSLRATIPVRGSLVYPLGDGFLVTGSAGVAAYL